MKISLAFLFWSSYIKLILYWFKCTCLFFFLLKLSQNLLLLVKSLLPDLLN